MLDTVETLHKKIFQILDNSRVKNIYNDLNKLSIDIILSAISKDYTYFVLKLFLRQIL
jgi:ABC-type Fe3+-citrate transport system substrate-binding protein